MPESMTLGQRLFIVLQYLLPKALLTWALGHVARAQLGPVTRFLVRIFIRHFNVDMNEAMNPDPDAYPTFNAFFTRRLRDGARPLPADPSAIASPCDGAVSECGALDGTRMLQAKGSLYSAGDLLGDPAWGDAYRDGTFATLYLSPKDYHRVHMPADGILERMVYIPGGLFSVNPTTVLGRRGLFARNERVVCFFRSPEGQTPGRFAMVLVGAMVVGGIRTVFSGRVTPRTPEAWQVPMESRIQLARGEEMGQFELGSTVILLFPGGTVGWQPDLAPGSAIRMGQELARTL